MPSRIVEAVHSVNEGQREYVFRRISRHFGDSLAGRKFAMWGMAFKAGTDDVRESPAVDLAAKLLAAGASLAVHDPQALENARTELGEKDVTYCRHMYETLPRADALIVCTEWPEYRSPDFGRMRKALEEPVIFDGRNLYDLQWMADLGFHYVSVGRPAVGPAGSSQ